MHFFRWQRFPRFAWLVTVGVLVTIDQASKAYFSGLIPLGASVAVTTWFNLVHVLNTGAAFSVLADAGGWQRYFLIAVSALVVVALSWVCLMTHTAALDRWMGAMLVGGGLGNLTDRVQTGAVVDFLDIHWRGLHWPAFNLADVWVVAAAGAWLLASLRAHVRSSLSSASKAPQ
ncbi:MAG: signal peptidase II [Burkholderiales bacterium]|nr:signal peptidase II [Burkholderiales bacterium]